MNKSYITIKASEIEIGMKVRAINAQTNTYFDVMVYDVCPHAYLVAHFYNDCGNANSKVMEFMEWDFFIKHPIEVYVAELHEI